VTLGLKTGRTKVTHWLITCARCALDHISSIGIRYTPKQHLPIDLIYGHYAMDRLVARHDLLRIQHHAS